MSIKENKSLSNSDLTNISSYAFKQAHLGKRVLALYRVSTDKQVMYDENNEADIPMQRRECRRFLEQQGWVLVHEEREDGISGHKVRAEKRDSIQNIKELALAKKFDILLVFMFDRIGRIADETPFIVEWLVKNGVRVWAAKEGEQRFDNHADKLMNYIRFWQADGESEKTSIRTKTSLGQLVEDGHYKGGNPAYGYKLVKSGRLDKKKNEKKNLAIIEEEAVVVRKVFDMYVNNGFGTRKIARLLADEGIKARTGKNFGQTSILNMIRNLTYTGILRSGESRSPLIQELQIVSPEIYQKANDIMDKRVSDAADARTYPMNANGRCLLNGKVYCADCGSRLIVTSNNRTYLENGVHQKRLVYVCYRKANRLSECNGQTTYSSRRVDRSVDEVIRHILLGMKNVPKNEVISSGLKKKQYEYEVRYKAAQRECVKAEADLDNLKSEVLKSIRGESKFSPDLLGELISQTEMQVRDLNDVCDKIRNEVNEGKIHIEEMHAMYDDVISWSELYQTSDLPTRKMIVANLVNRVEVARDCVLHIDLNIDLSLYDIQLDLCTHEYKKAV
jgi:DNA invertase Pin-like site-specific DNA recombinase